MLECSQNTNESKWKESPWANEPHQTPMTTYSASHAVTASRLMLVVLTAMCWVNDWPLQQGKTRGCWQSGPMPSSVTTHAHSLMSAWVPSTSWMHWTSGTSSNLVRVSRRSSKHRPTSTSEGWTHEQATTTTRNSSSTTSGYDAVTLTLLRWLASQSAPTLNQPCPWPRWGWLRLTSLHLDTNTPTYHDTYIQTH